MIYVLQLPVNFIIPTGRSSKPKLRGRSWHIGWQTIAVGQPAAMLWHCRVMLFPIRLFLFHYFSKEGKVAVMLSSAARHKDVVTTTALDVRWSFTPHIWIAEDSVPCTQWVRGWLVPQPRFECCGKEKYLLRRESIPDWPTSRPFCSLITTATEPCRVVLAVHNNKWYFGSFWPLPRMRDLRFSLILKMAALRYSETSIAI